MSASPEEVTAATTAEPLPASDESPETPKGAESAPAVKDTDEKKPSEGFTKRIDELTRDYRETERRLQAAERREQALIDRLSREAPKSEPPVETQPKTLADFQYDEAKFLAHVSATAEARAVEAAKRELTQARQQENNQARLDDFLAREEDFAKDVPDYYEVTRNERLPLAQGSPLFETVMDSEKGHEIVYYLGKNLRLAEQIARLPPLQQAREIGRIEAKLSEKPSPPKVSQAPPPVSTIAPTADAVVEKDPAKMTDTEFAKMRRKQIARRRGWERV